jgi:fibronectin type 3 domain-containing protein
LYFCQVVAVDTANNDSPPSAQIVVTTPTLPSAPVDVTATAIAATKVTVSWTENNTNGLGIANYTVFYGTSSPPTTSKTATGSPYTVTGLLPNTTYYFAVEANDTGRDPSPMSAVKSATTLPAPSAPTNVTPTANSPTQVTVTWTENNTNGLSIKTYTVFRGLSAGSLTQLGTTPKTSYTDTSVAASTTYYYAVEATDTEGDPPSPMSAVVPVTTPAP